MSEIQIAKVEIYESQNSSCPYLKDGVIEKTGRPVKVCIGSAPQIAVQFGNNLCKGCSGNTGEEEIARNYLYALAVSKGEIDLGLPKRTEIQNFVQSTWEHVEGLIEPLYDEQEIELFNKIVSDAINNTHKVKFPQSEYLIHDNGRKFWCAYKSFPTKDFGKRIEESNLHEVNMEGISPEERQRQADIAIYLHDYFALVSSLLSDPFHAFHPENESYKNMTEKLERATKLKNIEQKDINYPMFRHIVTFLGPDSKYYPKLFKKPRSRGKKI